MGLVRLWRALGVLALPQARHMKPQTGDFHGFPAGVLPAQIGLSQLKSQLEAATAAQRAGKSRLEQAETSWQQARPAHPGCLV